MTYSNNMKDKISIKHKNKKENKNKNNKLNKISL